MRINTKAMLSPNAPLKLICTHGAAAVLTVTGAVGGVVFLKHDWTGVKFIADESDIEVLASDDAVVQRLIYEAHIDVVKRERKAREEA